MEGEGTNEAGQALRGRIRSLRIGREAERSDAGHGGRRGRQAGGGRPGRESGSPELGESGTSA